MRYLLLAFIVRIGLNVPAMAQQPQVTADTVATRYQLPGADCALFPANASLPFSVDESNPLTRRFTPTHQQVAATEKALGMVNLATVNPNPEAVYYAKYPALIKAHLAKYRRQYFGFYSLKHHPCLYINLFDEQVVELPGTVPYWLRSIVVTYDGGAAFWSIYYDLTTRKFYKFHHNSEG